MKHLTRFALVGAIMLAGLLSCEREMVQTVPNNPTYDADANTVTTKIILDVSTSRTPQTRTTAAYAQAGENPHFLGMEAVHLLTYKLPYAPFGKEMSDTTVGKFFYRSSVSALRDYDLGNLFDAGDVTSQSSSRAVELALPLETNCLVLYGKALKSGTDDQQGAIGLKGDPADLKTLAFYLQPRLQDTTAYYGGCELFQGILTGMLVAGLVDEQHFWQVSANNQVYTVPVGSRDRRYKFWWPQDNGTPTVYKRTSGVDYQDGEAYTENSKYVLHWGELSWKQLGIMYDWEYDDDETTNPLNVTTNHMALSGLGESLGEAYSRLTNVRSQRMRKTELTDPAPDSILVLKELRAGSAESVLRTIQDLYAVVNKASTSKPTGWEEEVARQLAEVISSRIESFFSVATDAASGTKSVTGFKSFSALIEDFKTNVAQTEWDQTHIDAVDASFLPTHTSGGFPMNLHMPQGAAILLCNRDWPTNATSGPFNRLDKFVYTQEIPAYGMGDGNLTFPIADYRYPAELMYYGNSAIRVSDEVVTQAMYPKEATLGADAWTTDANWGNKWHKNRSVTSTTRSVAMVHRINYGTALLQSHVGYSDAALNNGLQDNKKAIFGAEENNVIPVKDVTTGLKVTGIIVGGQPDTVGWHYTRKPTGFAETVTYDESTKKFDGLFFVNSAFNKMIYDMLPSPFRIGDSQADNNIYTFCWDNYDATLAADKQSDVYVALELENHTGQDFWGELNVVRDGGTFYLVGKLSLENAKNLTNFAHLERTDYNYPIYKPQTGETVDAPRVFMQDYCTVANLIIGETSLQHAYVTVPDLRSNQVSLGVSIDMKWETGLQFDVDMGKL